MPQGKGLSGTAGLVEEFGHVEEGVGIVGVEIDGDLEGILGCADFALLLESAAELNPGLDVFVVERDGNVVAFDGSGEIARSVEKFGENEVPFGPLGSIDQGHPEGFDGFVDFARLGETATFGEPFVGSPMVLNASGNDGEVIIARFGFGGIEIEEALAGDRIDPAFVVAIQEGAIFGEELQLIEREFFSAEFGEAFDALLQTMKRDAGVEEFHQLADG